MRTILRNNVHLRSCSAVFISIQPHAHLLHSVSNTQFKIPVLIVQGSGNLQGGAVCPASKYCSGNWFRIRRWLVHEKVAQEHGFDAGFSIPMRVSRHHQNQISGIPYGLLPRVLKLFGGCCPGTSRQVTLNSHRLKVPPDAQCIYQRLQNFRAQRNMGRPFPRNPAIK